MSISPEDRDAAESVHERVYRAAEHLATGAGDVRDRLRGVGLDLLPLQTKEFPADLQDDFDWVMKQLTRFQAKGDEGDLEATLRRIKNSTGSEIAKRVWSIFARVQEIRDRRLA